MQVKINRVDDAFHFEALGSAPNIKIHIDGALAIGGNNQGVRPMELLLMGLGSCSAFDLLIILKKQRQIVDDIQITVDGVRNEHQVPSVFTHIHIHFALKGRLEQDKVSKACELAVTKYCSVHDMLVKTASITYDFSILN